MPSTTPLTFRCPNDLMERIDAIGMTLYPKSEIDPDRVKYNRALTLQAILTAGCHAIDSGYQPENVRSPDPSLSIRSLIRSELEDLAEAIVEHRLDAAIKEQSATALDRLTEILADAKRSKR